jgi:iron complex transport system ATP-binding protein
LPDTGAIELDHVTVRMAGRQALGPLSLSIGAGQRWVLLGPNGGGKTTLLSVIGARLQPTSGAARVLGHTYGRADMRAVRSAIGHTSHTLSDMLPAGLRVLDVVLTGKRAVLAPWFQRYDEADRDLAHRRLAEVGAADLAERTFATCSQGERQRVLLARAMFADTSILVLDEPCAGLDLGARERLLAAIDASAASRPDLIVVLATHHLEEVPASSTHAALVANGSLMASGAIGSTLTSSHLTSCFGIDVEVRRRKGRWHATAHGLPPRLGPSADARQPGSETSGP